ncbi:unnamed protein product [Symbiodinium sp. KB8]|nr:unnamed protein product [Symbiodinium sp. KB8]
MFGLGGGKKEEKKDDEDGDDNKEEEDDKGDDKGDGGDDGGDGEGEEEVTQVAKTRKINPEQFLKEVEERSAPPPRGETEQDWDVLFIVAAGVMMMMMMVVVVVVVVRRKAATSDIRLNLGSDKQVRIENMTDEAILVFANFIFGGTKEPRGFGDGEDTECDFDTSFEWHRLEIWNWARWRVNKFDCFAEEQLLGFAKGPIQNEMECNKAGALAFLVPPTLGLCRFFGQEKKKLARLEGGQVREEAMSREGMRLVETLTGVHRRPKTFVASSEILDPQVWRASSLPTCARILHRLREGIDEEDDDELGGGVTWLGSTGGARGSMGRSTMGVTMTKAATMTSDEMTQQIKIQTPGLLKFGSRGSLLRREARLTGSAAGFSRQRGGRRLFLGVLVRRTDDFSDELDLRKRYLFVKVIKVVPDRVVTPDTRPTDEIDTFVEVTFDGVAKRTRICQDDVSPSFNDDLIFELALAKTGQGTSLQEDNEATWEELERKGPVFIDLWTVGSKANEHLGSVESFLQDILVDETGQPQKEVSRTARDVRLKRQEQTNVLLLVLMTMMTVMVMETFSVRAFRGHKRLKFTWGPGQGLEYARVPSGVCPSMDEYARAFAEAFEEKQGNWKLGDHGAHRLDEPETPVMVPFLFVYEGSG